MHEMIESKEFEHDGFTVRIEVVYDADVTPHEFECYSPEQIRAWSEDQWVYVGYIYTASRNGIQLGESSIWGSEWFDDSSIDAWIEEDYYHPGLMRECITEARQTLKALTECPHYSASEIERNTYGTVYECDACRERWHEDYSN